MLILVHDFIAHPRNEEQKKAIRAFLEALEVPYETAPETDETTHLLSTEANAQRIYQALADEQEGKVSRFHSMI